MELMRIGKETNSQNYRQKSIKYNGNSSKINIRGIHRLQSNSDLKN